MAIATGTRLGPYEVSSAIGAGVMGEVYRAKDTRLGRDVAIKILPQHLSSSPQLRERFEREARAISSLNHPRICTLHDVGHQDGVDFLVMEYLEGESLAERLRRGPLPLKDALRIGMDVCEALDVAHRAGIIHRDLKPGNIMLTKSGGKLMDFGLAKTKLTGGGNSSAPLLSAAETIGGAATMSPLTTDGQVLGTIQYMSPEQIEGKEADARSDIFALGGILYEMATGKRPFEGKSQISVASAILEKDPEPISSTRKEVTPPEFERVVNTCLAKNPDDRFQSARDVRLELKWVAELPSQAAARAAVTTAAPSTATRIVPWAIVALLAVALVGLFFLGERKRPEPQYTMVTFRDGTLEAARFSHDGQTVVYSGEWEGQPRQVYTYRVGRPESRELGIPSATVASVSSSDGLAVFHDCERVFVLDCGGTLATVSVAGGSPRDVAGHIAYADWSPDGQQLVVSKFSAQGASLEFPPGHVLYQQKTGWLGRPRFSPDGKMIAFENHPGPGDDGSVDVVDVTGNHRVLSKGWLSIEGLAWSRDGKEVWFASNSPHSGWADTIHAATLSGKERSILTMPSVRLHDISTDGRVLLSRENFRAQLRGYFPGDKQEHPYSWLDSTTPTGTSADGRWISFLESGEVWSITGDNQSYFRSTDGSPPVSIGPGIAAISADGKWVATSSMASHKLTLQPVGLGEAKELPGNYRV
jgi:eukaryotic-like serine/threonine-protein kinase